MIAVDPSEVVELHLDSDAAKPAAERPTFLAHPLTERESNKVNTLLDEYRVEGTTLERKGEIRTAIFTLALTDWRNVRDRTGAAVPFDPASLPDLLTIGETMELLGKSLGLRDVDEKKDENSASSPATDTESSAPTAPVVIA